jgi:hypothetical protein
LLGGHRLLLFRACSTKLSVATGFLVLLALANYCGISQALQAVTVHHDLAALPPALTQSSKLCSAAAKLPSVNATQQFASVLVQAWSKSGLEGKSSLG